MLSLQCVIDVRHFFSNILMWLRLGTFISADARGELHDKMTPARALDSEYLTIGEMQRQSSFARRRGFSLLSKATKFSSNYRAVCTH